MGSCFPGSMAREGGGMKTVLLLFLLALLPLDVLAEIGSADQREISGKDLASMTSQIGKTMFAYYQMSYHDQLSAVATLRYCGAENMAGQVADTIPDFSFFYLQKNPLQLLYDIVNKEALIQGYTVTSEKEFDLIANQSLVKGQSYFLGYLRGYQIAMESFFDKKVMEPFCQAAVDEADKFIQKESLVSQNR